MKIEIDIDRDGEPDLSMDVSPAKVSMLTMCIRGAIVAVCSALGLVIAL